MPEVHLKIRPVIFWLVCVNSFFFLEYQNPSKLPQRSKPHVTCHAFWRTWGKPSYENENPKASPKVYLLPRVAFNVSQSDPPIHHADTTSLLFCFVFCFFVFLWWWGSFRNIIHHCIFPFCLFMDHTLWRASLIGKCVRMYRSETHVMMVWWKKTHPNLKNFLHLLFRSILEIHQECVSFINRFEV